MVLYFLSENGNKNYSLERCIAQLGSAPALGAGGRRFKSYYTDHYRFCGSSSVGRASAFQAECREFDPRLPLHFIYKNNLVINIMVTVVQLVERQFVALVVAGSSPVGHPINYEPLAQSVEHLTFNQGVTGSIPVWLTI